MEQPLKSSIASACFLILDHCARILAIVLMFECSWHNVVK